MRAALEDADLKPEMVGDINAHGTGTLANDSSEAAAIRLVFGTHTERLAVSSTKSMHGHALGAAGALETVATVLSLQNDVIPPTANFIEAIPSVISTLFPICQGRLNANTRCPTLLASKA